MYWFVVPNNNVISKTIDVTIALHRDDETAAARAHRVGHTRTI